MVVHSKSTLQLKKKVLKINKRNEKLFLRIAKLLPEITKQQLKGGEPSKKLVEKVEKIRKEAKELKSLAQKLKK